MRITKLALVLVFAAQAVFAQIGVQTAKPVSPAASPSAQMNVTSTSNVMGD